MLLEHGLNYALGIDALVTSCSWNTTVILVWAWMLGYALLIGGKQPGSALGRKAEAVRAERSTYLNAPKSPESSRNSRAPGARATDYLYIGRLTRLPSSACLSLRHSMCR